MVATPACPVHVVGRQIVDRGVGWCTEPRCPTCSGRRSNAAAAPFGCSSTAAWLQARRPTSESGRATAAGRGSGSSPSCISGCEHPSRSTRTQAPWTIAGENAAYFVGWCPACGYGTVLLTVTLEGGGHFRPYKIPRLNGFRGTGIRVAGDRVTITAESNLRYGPRTQTVTATVHQA